MIAAALAAATLACAPAVSGATAPEQAAIDRIVCLMPGTLVRGVQVVSPPARAKAPAGSIGLRLLLDGNPALQGLGLRANWEAGMAAAAIADGFRRLHLRPVSAYAAAPVGTPPTQLDQTTEIVHGLLPRVFESTANGFIGPPKTLGMGVGTWLRLDARLDALDRRFGVHHSLVRMAPFGKAPVVIVSAPDLVQFLGGPGIVGYLNALRWSENRYDGVYLGVRSGGRLVWEATVDVRPGGGAGCAYAIPLGEGRVDAAERACTLAGAESV
ncbi:MAG: hypothetical protein QOE36_450 [Gaiellaceae bacterium]|jgi:hypothetical protein|nr:hypothetical protein [Gaiellaceae bacterium]